MPLIFSAVVPNSPQLALELLQPDDDPKTKTFETFKELEGELYFMKPDTLIVLTAHGTQVPELINMNISTTVTCECPPEYQQLEQLKKDYACDVEFAARLKGVVDTQEHEVPLTIIAEPTVPVEVMTPLTFLMDHLTETRVIVMSTANFSIEEHYLFGEFLEEHILQTNKRVAIVASGHLSSNAERANAEKETFDQLCLQCLKENKREEILRLNNHILEKTDADITIPLSVLLGTISKVNVDPEVMSYEQLHGFGQLIGNFVIK